MQPSVFVSSTYVDLRHVREHVAKFIDQMGYKPVLFEKGGIGFDWQKPIDESCYDGVLQSDILVLIIGGRYGSPASKAVHSRAKKFNSITKNEYITARTTNIPIHIFVDANVLGEYRTYQKNLDNDSIQYASVDSPQIFELLNDIYAQNVNNYVHPLTNS
jgi:Domain of unknown function (DUF4062)